MSLSVPPHNVTDTFNRLMLNEIFGPAYVDDVLHILTHSPLKDLFLSDPRSFFSTHDLVSTNDGQPDLLLLLLRRLCSRAEKILPDLRFAITTTYRLSVYTQKTARKLTPKEIQTRCEEARKESDSRKTKAILEEICHFLESDRTVQTSEEPPRLRLSEQTQWSTSGLEDALPRWIDALLSEAPPLQRPAPEVEDVSSSTTESSPAAKEHEPVSAEPSAADPQSPQPESPGSAEDLASGPQEFPIPDAPAVITFDSLFQSPVNEPVSINSNSEATSRIDEPSGKPEELAPLVPAKTFPSSGTTGSDDDALSSANDDQPFGLNPSDEKSLPWDMEPGTPFTVFADSPSTTEPVIPKEPTSHGSSFIDTRLAGGTDEALPPEDKISEDPDFPAPLNDPTFTEMTVPPADNSNDGVELPDTDVPAAEEAQPTSPQSDIVAENHTGDIAQEETAPYLSDFDNEMPSPEASPELQTTSPFSDPAMLFQTPAEPDSPDYQAPAADEDLSPHEETGIHEVSEPVSLDDKTEERPLAGMKNTGIAQALPALNGRTTLRRSHHKTEVSPFSAAEPPAAPVAAPETEPAAERRAPRRRDPYYLDPAIELSLKLKGGLKARGHFNPDGSFTLLRGSQVRQTPALQPNPLTRELREQYAAFIVNGVLSRDLIFTSSSAAAKFVSFSSISGPLHWKAPDGLSLRDYCDKLRSDGI